MSESMIVGVDIGGTFTDFAMLDPATGRLHIGKQLTTPDDPSRALLEGMDALCKKAKIQYSDIDRISHATTLVTNAIIERKGSKTGFLVTDGFRDILLMGRESRYDHYDFRFDRPEPLVARSATREIDERVGWDASVIRPLNVDSVRAAVREIAGQGIRSIAICLLHSYRNPGHEREIQKIMESEFPDIDCTISSDVAPEIREYERASTAVSNAYVRPLVRQYLGTLDAKLRDKGFGKHVHVMLSNGGLSSTETAQKVPIQLIESGPAAGALAASVYAQTLGMDRVLAFDMGGTTAKMCCIEGGKPHHANAFEAARVRRFKKGSGLPLLIPVIELIEIGAGGGSIARIDDLGLLKVGPESAGAKPGPAAYGLGGELPTVTDADVVLGYIDPDHFLGGDMVLDLDKARQAISDHVASPLKTDVTAAAWGIFNVVNEAMVAAGRRYAAECGLDVRDFSLITFGGAAPIHAWQVAEILGIGKLVFPLGAGATSAVGLCVAAPVVNLSRTHLVRLDEALRWGDLSTLILDMEGRARDMLLSAGASRADVEFTRSVDIRYAGQGYEIEVNISGIDLATSNKSILQEISDRFRVAYTRAYGRTLDSEELEAVTWRVKAAAPPLSLAINPGRSAGLNEEPVVGRREVYFGPKGGFVQCPVYDRYRLGNGDHGIGPALFQERETTVVVNAGSKWNIDQYLNMIVVRE